MHALSADLLERQLAYLERLSDLEFLFAVGDSLKALEADPELARHMSDLCCEADDLGRTLREVELDGGIPERTLDRLWDELDSGLRDPHHVALVKARTRFRSLLADVEHPVVVPLDPNAGGEDDSRIGHLVRMVADFDDDSGARIIDRMRTSFDGVREQQEALHLRQLRLTRTHAGVALLRMRCLAANHPSGAPEEAASCPRSQERPPALVVRADAGGRSWARLLNGLLTGRDELERLELAPQLLAALRGAASRLILELSSRIGTVRSRLAMIDRYKARCEWHDRERLFQLAEEATGARESSLRDELALYLFDNGLNPISEASLGSHSRADVFHAAARDSFVLEAKQYTNGTGLDAALRAAFRQALDTVGNLRGSGYEADEAFVVLFRRGGPRVILPTDPIVADGLSWYLRLINIAPAEADASRNKETPKEYTTEALRAMLIDEASRSDLPAPDVQDLSGSEADQVI
jgi:hypothetical protein